MNNNNDDAQDLLARYDLALKSSATALWDWDIENDSIQWSKDAHQVLRLESPKQLPASSKDFFERLVFVDDREAIRTNLREYLNKKGDINLQIRIIDSAGHLMWVHTRAQAIWNAKNIATRMYGTFVDINHLKNTEQQLAQKNTDINSIIRLASHDLRSPLRAISGFLELLEMKYAEQLDDVGRTYISHAQKGALEMESLINAVVDYARLEGHASQIEDINLTECIENVLQRFIFEIEEQEIDIQYTALPQIKGYKNLIEHLFECLIDNSLTHGQTCKRITISAKESESHYNIHYRDNGDGLPKDSKDNIFQAFSSRTKNEGDYKSNGTGLAVCKRIVELHQGKIWIDEDQGSGFALSFTIPRAMTEDT